MAHCINCQSNIDDDEQHYDVCDIGPEIISIIEQHIGFELTGVNEALCQECFDGMTNVLSPRLRYEAVENENMPLPYETNVCVVCRSSLYQRRCHGIPPGPERNIIADQIRPRQIPPGGLVCHSYWQYTRLMRRRNAGPLEQPAAPRDVPVLNTNRCVCCRVSLNTRRRHSLPEGPVRDDIAARILPRQIPVGGRVCYACWVRARRNVERQERERDNPDPNPIYDRHHDVLCALCEISLHRRRTHALPNGPMRDIVAARIHPRELPNNALLCPECWTLVRGALVRAEVENEPFQEIPHHPLSVRISCRGYRITTRSSAHCFVPGCTRAERRNVPHYLRKHLLRCKKIFVNTQSRVCEEHIICYDWDFLDVDGLSPIFTVDEVEEALNLSTADDTMFLNFENVESIDESFFRMWTGVRKIDFNIIFQNTPSLNNCKQPKTALGLYLMKCRTGESHERLANLLQISKAKVVRLLKVAREALTREFVPMHLGMNHLSRENIVSRNLTIPEGLFGEGGSRKPIVIVDGTYIYVQKSSNYLFQKQTYSLHKCQNLVKPLLMVTTDGHILDIFGPYPATSSDADIMRALFQDENGDVRSFFREDDIFILDRGFRDAIPLLTELGYRVFKPESLEQGQTQLSTEMANRSRCVTLCRWVVEVVNGRFKRDYKLFRADFFNLASPHLMEDFRICGALINAFHREIVDRPDALQILNRALQRYDLPNELAEFVIVNNLNRRRAHFSRINEQNPHLDIFPRMAMSDLILFALGTYQIKQARSYYGEHLREHGTFVVEVCSIVETADLGPSETLLIRGRIRSRHQSNKIYNTYITLSPEGNSWENTIEQYYCSCLCGKRTVGCCAHVMTIVWYLGWARHQDSVEPPAQFLDGILITEIENEIDE